MANPSRAGLLVLTALALAAVPARAQQQPSPRLSADCDYARCAYNIIPALHGLVVTRGADEAKVGTLGFLWTRDISGAFDPAAQDEARGAVRARRWAALFTDLGLALLVAGGVGAAADALDDTDATLMLAGAATFGISVPIQFLADARLARAVWLHNARFAAGSIR